jgi:hypothetical protein
MCRKLVSINVHAYQYRKCGIKHSEWPPYSENWLALTICSHLQTVFILTRVVNTQGLLIWETSSSFYYFFNDTVNSSHVIVLNDSMITNELGRMWSWGIILVFALKGLRKTNKQTCHDSLFPGWDSNHAPLTEKYGTLQPRQLTQL